MPTGKGQVGPVAFLSPILQGARNVASNGHDREKRMAARIQNDAVSPLKQGGDLPGVNWFPVPAPAREVAQTRDISRRLVAAGVAYGEHESGRVPWLVGTQPFHLSTMLHKRTLQLGQAIFRYLDAVQALYARGEPLVRATLDANVPADLRGLQLDRPVVTFRLDVAIQDGRPMVTEIEEIHGNVGKMAAMQEA